MNACQSANKVSKLVFREQNTKSEIDFETMEKDFRQRLKYLKNISRKSNKSNYSNNNRSGRNIFTSSNICRPNFLPMNLAKVNDIPKIFCSGFTDHRNSEDLKTYRNSSVEEKFVFKDHCTEVDSILKKSSRATNNDQSSTNTNKIKSTCCLSDESNKSAQNHKMKCGSYKASDTSLKTNYQSLNNKYSSSNLFVPHQVNYNKKFFVGANISEVSCSDENNKNYFNGVTDSCCQAIEISKRQNKVARKNIKVHKFSLNQLFV